jgi:hypothetical protein
MEKFDPIKFVLQFVELIFKLIDQYIPSPAKEIILSTFGAALLGGMIYGIFFRGFSPREVSHDEETEEDDRTPLKRQISKLKNLLKISLIERYYLYFNGIANASLMLGFAVLVDRRWSNSPRDGLPVKDQIGSFISILLAGLITSIILNVVIDLIAEPPLRRTDAINRAFLVSFAVNVLVFAAYHFNYLNL